MPHTATSSRGTPAPTPRTNRPPLRSWRVADTRASGAELRITVEATSIPAPGEWLPGQPPQARIGITEPASCEGGVRRVVSEVGDTETDFFQALPRRSGR